MTEAKETDSAKTSGGPPTNISTGIDMEAISRFKGLMRKKTFIERVFTEDEYAYCLGKRNPARHLAARFTAKEACLKALGTGLTSGIKWRDIEVITSEDGSTGLSLGGRARDLLRRDKKIFLSLSYGAGLAVAVVVIG